MAKFQDYYQQNRRLQLTGDLAPPAKFAETYQAFIAQVAGFFVIEARVQHSAAALSGSSQVLS